MRLNTLGYMAERLQRSPGAIEEVIALVSIQPALVLNGLAYYAVEDENFIGEYLQLLDVEAAQHGQPAPILRRSDWRPQPSGSEAEAEEEEESDSAGPALTDAGSSSDEPNGVPDDFPDEDQ